MGQQNAQSSIQPADAITNRRANPAGTSIWKARHGLYAAHCLDHSIVSLWQADLPATESGNRGQDQGWPFPPKRFFVQSNRLQRPE